MRPSAFAVLRLMAKSNLVALTRFLPPRLRERFGSLARCCHDGIVAIESAVEREPVVPAIWSAGLRLTRREPVLGADGNWQPALGKPLFKV